MQNIIDLDKLVSEFTVQIDGQEYTVRQMTVKQMIDASKLDTPESNAEALSQNIKEIAKSSNIPLPIGPGL